MSKAFRLLFFFSFSSSGISFFFFYQFFFLFASVLTDCFFSYFFLFRSPLIICTLGTKAFTIVRSFSNIEDDLRVLKLKHLYEPMCFWTHIWNLYYIDEEKEREETRTSAQWNEKTKQKLKKKEKKTNTTRAKQLLLVVQRILANNKKLFKRDNIAQVNKVEWIPNTKNKKKMKKKKLVISFEYSVAVLHLTSK